MTNKRPIDQKRDSAGSFQVGTTDEGPTTSMVVFNDSLYVIKKSAIYAVQMADQIDPERKNFDLANAIHYRVLSEGSDSELVGRILLTAANLFGKGTFLPPSFEHDRALTISLDALISAVGMRTAATEFDVAQQDAWAHAQQQQRTAGSMQIPSTSDVATRCKTFFQRADHAGQALFDIVQLFYADLGKGGWEALLERAESEYGKDDPFTGFLDQALPFFLLVRNTRDCLEHNLKGAVVRDFQLLPDGRVLEPTIEINFRQSRQPAVPVSSFMTEVTTSMTVGFELMIVYLCSKHVQGPLPVTVGEIPENRRGGQHVRYCYGMYYGEDFVPMGG